MRCCSVKSCKNWNKNTKNKNISFHKSPNDEDLQKLWANACGADNINIKNARICSIHFSDKCFEDVPEYLLDTGITIRKRLTANAIPTKYLTDTISNTESNSDKVENSPVGQDESLHQAEFQANSLLENKIENNYSFYDVQRNNVNNNNNHNTRGLQRKANVLVEYDTNQCPLNEPNLNNTRTNKNRY